MKTNSTDLAISAIILDAWETRLDDPNDDITRRWFITHLTSMLEPLVMAKRIGRYLITCDETNNPPSVLENNGLGLHVAWTHHYRDVDSHYLNSLNEETLHLFKPRPGR